jgi:hypothetical protein
MKIFNFFSILFFSYYTNALQAKNGTYTTNSYLYYSNTNDKNPINTEGKYIVNINISEFTGQGEIIIKDVKDDFVWTHKINGKIKEGYDQSTNQITKVYNSTNNVYNFSEDETLIILIDQSTGKINCVVSKNKKTTSETYFCNLTPIEETLPCTGSGFLVNSNGYIITNYHVVKNSTKILVKINESENNRTYTAHLVNYNSENDIALLKIEPINFPIPYSISNKQQMVGESILSLGYPMISEMGDEIKATDGIVSSNSGFRNDVRYYQISCPIQPGNSGCPLFNSKGEIIGLVTSGLTIGQNVGYALKSNYIIAFLRLNSIPIPIDNLTQQLTLTQKISRFKNIYCHYFFQ